MSQRYTSEIALSRMLDNLCPECGHSAYEHSADNRFWVPRACTLLPVGVTERINQYFADLEGLPQTKGGPHE